MTHDRDVGFTPGAGAGSPDHGTTSDPAGAAERMQETARDMGDQVRELASDVGHRASHEVEHRLADRKDQAAETLSDVAHSLRTASDQLPEHEGIGEYMVRAAGQVDRVASFLNEHEVVELLHEAEDLARRQPALFVGGAFALGVLGARFLKSSRRDLHEDGAPGTRSLPAMEERIQDPGRDAVGRPTAAGYEPPPVRGDDEFRASENR